MKTLKRLLVLAFLTAFAIIFYGCKKDAEIPTVNTTTVSLTTETTATAIGTVTSGGGVEVTARGVCWSTAHNPTVADNKTVDGTGVGSFTSNITGLTANSVYYVRAYATNSEGTAYGNEISFTTYQITLAIVTSAAITDITKSGAISGGNITSNGGSRVTDWGVCWSTTENPTTNDTRFSLTGGSGGSGTFTCNLTGLNPGTIYFVRAYAINSAGVAYGDQLSFVTESVLGSIGTRKTDFPGVSNYDAASFSIGTKAYIGMGIDYGDWPTKEFWEWDQATNIWTRKADFPGRLEGIFLGFSIGTKGYVETGSTYFPVNIIPNEFWEYDPAANIWTQKAAIPVTPGRNASVGFSIGTKGYIGLGVKAEGQFNSYFRDFWEYDPATNVWTQKADFEGNIRSGAVGFSIGKKGYVGNGSDGITASKEFWEWDQATDVWTRKADFGGMIRYGSVGFSIENKGYLGLGYNSSGSSLTIYNDIWEWDQATNTWVQKADFRGIARISAVGFSIGSKGYIGIGNNGNNYFSDFWEYDPNLK